MKRKAADQSDEKIVQIILDLPAALVRLERRINEIEAKQDLILQYQKSPVDKIEAATRTFVSAIEASNAKLDASGKAFAAAVKQWMPVQWSSLPMWLDGMDQQLRKWNEKMNDLCTLVAQFVRRPAPATEPKLRGLMLGAMKEIAAALKEEPDGNKGTVK